MIEEIQLLNNSLTIKLDDNCKFPQLMKTGRSIDKKLSGPIRQFEN